MERRFLIRRAENVPAQHRADHPGYEYTRHIILGSERSRNISLAVYEIPPGKSSFPYHYHLQNEETFLILEGE